MANVTESRQSRPAASSDRLEVRIYSVTVEGNARSAMVTFALIACALLAGIAISFVLSPNALTGVNRNTILIALGTLCLGFGSASVIYQHYRSKHNAALKAQFESLRARAEALLREFEAYENKPNAIARGH